MATGPHSNKLVIDKSLAQRSFFVVLSFSLCAFLAQHILEQKSASLDDTLVDRAAQLADISSNSQSCLVRLEEVEDELQTVKAEVKQLRRHKNDQALEANREERRCQQQLVDMGEHRQKEIEYELNSANAKLSSDKQLGLQYWMAEALARLQDRDARAVWEQKMSSEELRNTLVVELSELLGKPVEELQMLEAVELIQIVTRL
eukprot:m.26646 g.26646  ORF g.26646 m.26646 type:complete len:203 (+) comp7819_c0_seq1:159-767(+)